MKSQCRFLSFVMGCIGLGVAFGCLVPVQASPKKHSAHKPARTAAPVRSQALPPLAPLPVLPPAATPVAQAGDVLLYDGQALEDAKIKISSWGGGLVEDNSQVSFSKGHTLKVTTLDPYQGAKLSFQSPISLGALADTARVLVFTLRLTADTRVFPQVAPTQQSPDTGNDVPVTDNSVSENNDAKIVMAQFQEPQGMSPVYQTPAPDAGAVPTAALAPPPQGLNKIHLIFTLANGAQADVLRPYPDLSRSDAGAGAEQWVNIGVPLAALHFTGSTADSPLQSITIAGDDYAVFYVGQIKLTQDTSPLTCFASVDDADIQRDTPVTLKSTASGGLSSLKYAWDFDASDGITEQASGPVVTTQYAQGQHDFTATLTVSDIDGLKKPVTSTVVLHVQ